MNTRKAGAIVVAFAVLGTLTGCAMADATADSAEITRSDLPKILISDEQSSAMGDGEVSRSEYDAGFARFAECMEQAGAEVIVSESDGDVIDYAVADADAIRSGDDQRCYEREFAQIDVAWQLAHEDTSETNRLYQACLEEHGIAPAADAATVWQQLLEAKIDPEACVQ